ncbi:prohead core scaffold [Vibrio phage YC]|uniref:Prohead core scaffold n=1 Tax=Vibrio phage YC TaxID=2267403 RepID=A0A384ZS89_9CAUD|nr:prohead core scaffold [Vibrio phage YC]AXC34516.1 prohead core scaffold [Vibrio phage YC]
MNIKALFEGVSGLSEEFTQRVEAQLTEAAEAKAEEIVAGKLQEAENAHAKEIVQLKESHAAELQEAEEAKEAAIAESTAQVVQTLDGFLDSVVVEWAQENAVAIDSNIKAQLGEQVLHGILNVVKENNLTVPENSDNLVESLESELEGMRAKCERLTTENQEFRNRDVETIRESVLESVTAGLADTQIDEVRSLCEGVTFLNEEQYKRKVTSFRNVVEEKDKTYEGDKGEGEDGDEGEDGKKKPVAEGQKQKPTGTQLSEAERVLQYL